MIMIMVFFTFIIMIIIIIIIIIIIEDDVNCGNTNFKWKYDRRSDNFNLLGRIHSALSRPQRSDM